MSYQKIFKDIKEKSFKKYYVFSGPEEYIKRSALNQLQEQMISDVCKDLNYMVMDGATVDSDDIIASCETLPFMSDKRLLVVMDYKGFSKSEDSDEKLIKYIGNIPDTTCLIFYNYGEVSKSSRLYKALAKKDHSILFNRLKDDELTRWTAKMFKKSGVDISAGDLRYFLFRAGNDLEDISNQINKLSAFALDGKKITRRVIEDMITPVPEHTIFQLIDAVSSRQSGKAIQLLNELIENGQPVLVILSMIARQYKMMILCKKYSGLGYNQAELAKKLEAHPYAIKKCLSQSKAFDFSQLKKAHDECLKLNYGIKEGAIKDRIGLELLVMNLCG